MAADPLDVVINEVAWMGTQANSADEWLELYNNTDNPIDLTGWEILEVDGAGVETVIEPLSGTIGAHSYYLIERTDDDTVSDIPADQPPSSWGGNGLSNDGERLILKDNLGNVIDEIDASSGWFAGTASPDYRSMERIDPTASGSDLNNWASNDPNIAKNGLDAGGNPINGTPKARNSATNLPPTADAGLDQIVNVGDVVQLDGSGSSDPDGDPLSYSWSFTSRPSGSTATLSDPNVASPTFIADVAGDYTLELTVDDGHGGSDADQVRIRALAANLVLTKADNPDPATVGYNLTYTLTVINNGPSESREVVIIDNLPTEVTFVSVTPSRDCARTGTSITCYLGALADGAAATVKIVVIPKRAGKLINTASVTSSTYDPDSTDNRVTEETTVNAPVGGDPPIYKNIVAFPTPEITLKTDLNGDGDTRDWILRYMDLNTGEVVNTGLIASGRHRAIDIYENIIVFVGQDRLIRYYDISSGTVEDLGVKGSHPSIFANIIAFNSGGSVHYYDLSREILINTGVAGHAPAIWGHLIAFYKGFPPTIHYYDLDTGEVRDTGAVGRHPSIYWHGIAFSTEERWLGQDLNHDGDTDDRVIRYYDLIRNEVINTGAVGRYPALWGSRIAFTTDEEAIGKDLNGDFDTKDRVIRYYELKAGRVFNTGRLGTEPDIYEDTTSFYLYESWSELDLSGDGDWGDPIVQIYKLEEEGAGTEPNKPDMISINEDPEKKEMRGNPPSPILDSILAYPNPVVNADTVHFRIRGQGIKAIKVEVFDLAGRLVFDSGFVTRAERSLELKWHFLSSQGQDPRVASGVYLYVIIAEGFNGEHKRSKVGKLAVLSKDEESLYSLPPASSASITCWKTLNGWAPLTLSPFMKKVGVPLTP